MLILDTNVVSELMKPSPLERVASWVDSLAAHDTYTTAITAAEVRLGIARLPAGRRRDGLTQIADIVFSRLFAMRVLPFSEECAQPYADIDSMRRALGRPIDSLDCQIAAIARLHGAKVATRNVKDFDGCRIALTDPWSE